MSDYLKAMKVKDRKEAEAFLERLTHEAMRADPTLNVAEARVIQLCNIGYHFGYLGDEDLAHALEVWPDAEHPILGRIFNDLPVDVLLRAGKAYASGGRAAAKAVVDDYRHEHVIKRTVS